MSRLDWVVVVASLISTFRWLLKFVVVVVGLRRIKLYWCSPLYVCPFVGGSPHTGERHVVVFGDIQVARVRSPEEGVVVFSSHLDELVLEVRFRCPL